MTFLVIVLNIQATLLRNYYLYPPSSPAEYKKFLKFSLLALSRDNNLPL